MEKYNLKSIITGLVVLIVGVVLIPLDIFVIKTETHLWISIGCSLIASALVILLNDFVVDKVKINPLDDWKIEKIYSTRAEKNADSDPELDKAHYQVDGIAFGLKSFRTKQTKRVESCLKRGVNFRLITMSPESSCVELREAAEKETPGQIGHTITELVKWANDLNKKGYKGKIIVKGYSCMTLDFYWRIDNELYIGPYWYGVSSQQTITYKFLEGGKGFTQYTDYFEQLWDDDQLLTPLTEVSVFLSRKRRRKQ